ncbi:apolipoprotein N-acyltransferase [Suttonella sp. R2A3]|uniref:apolipoprotein N-acyltransferase n=1 Tax=Suttonella sp. R2A3 TaxID=2908648 RepID=UPI001F197AB1|nr:apolipoprotein N-acyltransferase [Suttonella sp. R2A3]UJF23682.1 apolipoprotein N-acyltransferase [Suttonella sp. R2A3]
MIRSNRTPFLFYLIAVILGSLLPLAFAPFTYGWLAIPLMLGLSWLWLSPYTHHPGRLGFVFGLGYFGFGLHWVYISLYAFGDAPLYFAIAANILLVTVMACFPMLCGWLLGKLSARTSAFRALLIPLLWSISELGRAYFLSGFPWLSIGYTQTQGIFNGLAPLGGVFSIGFVLVLIVSLIAYAWFKHRLAPAIFALALIGIALATRLLEFTTPTGTPLSVALVQGNVAQSQKFDPEHQWANLEQYIELSAPRDEAVIVWPETAIAFMESDLQDTTLAQLDEQFMRTGQTLVTGIPSGDLAERIYYNAVITLGSGEGRFYKHHLLPFGEYLPLRPVFAFFDDFVDIPYSDFTRGDAKQTPITTNGIPAGVSICFEAAFGRDIRQALPQAQYLINVSNDSWFKDSIAADQHLQMNQMRAQEMGREIARATNDGITAVINTQGAIRARLPRFQPAVLSEAVQPYTGLTPYAQFGNQIVFAVLALYAMMLGFFYITHFRYGKNDARALSSSFD